MSAETKTTSSLNELKHMRRFVEDNINRDKAQAKEIAKRLFEKVDAAYNTECGKLQITQEGYDCKCKTDDDCISNFEIMVMDEVDFPPFMNGDSVWDAVQNSGVANDMIVAYAKDMKITRGVYKEEESEKEESDEE